MARKKYEFRPDRTDSGFLNKLYLTKKQQLSLLKWALYALVVLVLSVVQDVILCKFRFFGATTDLVPLAILLICLLQDTPTGCVFALIASAMYLFSGSSPGEYVLVLLTALSVGASIFRQSYLRQGAGTTFLCLSLAMTLYQLTVFAVCLAMGLTHLGRLSAFLLSGVYSLVLFPILYPIVRNIGRIGGETWND